MAATICVPLIVTVHWQDSSNNINNNKGNELNDKPKNDHNTAAKSHVATQFSTSVIARFIAVSSLYTNINIIKHDNIMLN